MPRHTYTGRVEGGRLTIPALKRKQMDGDIAKYEGKLVEVQIRPLARRSTVQNAYYWGVVVDLVMQALRDLGHDVSAEDTHELIKSRHNPRPLCNADGEVIGEIGGTTTDLGKDEFSAFMERVKVWAATYLGICIPDPMQQMTMPLEQ